jgi:hypothetical protein
MSQYINPAFADFVFCNNNGISALKPGRNGHFAAMCRDGARMGDLVWVFGPMTYEGRDRELVADTVAIDVMHGGHGDFLRLRTWIESLGFTITYESCNVPCSNGRRKMVENVRHFSDAELARLRKDNPRSAIGAYYMALDERQ